MAEYEDSVIVVSRKGNVGVADGKQTSTVLEGQESTLKKRKAAGADFREDSGGRRRGVSPNKQMREFFLPFGFFRRSQALASTWPPNIDKLTP
jgi:hypothetical protein